MKGLVRLSLVLAVAALGAVPSPASAQQPAPGRIAFVNARALLTSMPGYAAAESAFTKEIEAGRAEAAKVQAQIDSLVASFEQRAPMLSASERDKQRQALQAQGTQLQQKQQEIQQRLGRREDELLAPMQERLIAVIEGIRAEGNYAMILDLGAQNTGVVTYDKSLDISARVAERLK